MLSFENDYAQGAHPLVLQRLVETNLDPQPGYGGDDFTRSALRKIREAAGRPEADIFLIAGGTQTNALVIGTVLKPWQGVVCAGTGHINVHEAGAVEFTGHKVLPLPHHGGKLDAGELRDYLTAFFADPNRSHMVEPGMVYISQPTEYGTLYGKAELEALSALCREYGLPLYMDGARLGYALAADPELTLPDYAALTDIFYIGGTKCGALCGEALVFPQGAPDHYDTLIKQRGALLAKGRLLGAQFDALFTGGLYTAICRPAVSLARELKSALLARGYELFIDSPTNQQFFILPNDTLRRLEPHVRFCVWEPAGDARTVIRLAASWATTPDMVRQLLALLP